ncbi:MAG: hypothetical protein HYV38_01230 [Candidatus Levybacteria bacterium]|nr:hypothetical protein [Candidatus Levybacteria bacterium]
MSNLEAEFWGQRIEIGVMGEKLRAVQFDDMDYGFERLNADDCREIFPGFDDEFRKIFPNLDEEEILRKQGRGYLNAIAWTLRKLDEQGFRVKTMRRIISNEPGLKTVSSMTSNQYNEARRNFRPWLPYTYYPLPSPVPGFICTVEQK